MVKGYFYLLASLVLSIWVLIKLQFILIPMVFAIILFVVLRPIHKRWLKMVRIPMLAVLLTLITALIPISLFIVFFSFQILDVIENFPDIGDKVQSGLDQALMWFNEISFLQQVDLNAWLERSISNAFAEPFDWLSVGISESTQTFANFFLTFLYLFFLLLYHDGLRMWVMMMLGGGNTKWNSILHEIKEMIEHYLIGVFTVVIILSVLNSVGLMVIGVQYAVFWGILAGFLALIPYIGTTIGGTFPFLYALATGDSWLQPALVVVLISSVQFIEGNFITPKIVGNQVSLNPLTAIVALVVGASMWGLSGIVLSIPLAGLVRIICSHFSVLQPLSFIMGTPVSEYKEEAEVT